MSDLIKSMGLKGSIPFVLLVICSFSLRNLFPYADILIGGLGIVLSVFYIDIYIENLRNELKVNNQNNRKELISELDSVKMQLNGELENLSTQVKSNNSTMNESKIFLSEQIFSLKSDLVMMSDECQNTIKSSQNEISTVLLRMQQDLSVEFNNTADSIIKNMNGVSKEFKESVSEVHNQLVAIENNMKIGNFETTKSLDNLRDEYAEFGNNLNTQLDSAIMSINDNFVVIGNALEKQADNLESLNNKIDENNKIVVSFVENMDDSKTRKTKITDEEIIEDKENSAVIINNSKDGLVIHSELRDDNKLCFMAGYKDGTILYNKSFDEDGNIISETTFYPNGQIKQRRTYVKRNGKIDVQLENF